MSDDDIIVDTLVPLGLGRIAGAVRVNRGLDEFGPYQRHQ